MRLLFLSTVYPTPWEPHKGPANRSTVESLRALGVEVEVIAPVPWPQRFLGRHHAAPPAQHPTYWYTPGIARRWYHQMMWRSIKSTLHQAATQFQPDAIVVFWTDPEGTAAVRLGKELNIPVAIIAGGSDLMLLPAKPARRKIISATLVAADHILAVGNVLVERAVELGAPPQNVSNFICGVDLTQFGPGNKRAAREKLGLDPEGALLLWIGSMLPVKAPERVLQAVELLAANQPGLKVAMVGSGEETARLQRMVALSPRLGGRVLFPGAVSHDVLPLWYHAADLFVLPSRSEGIPNVLLEAMAVGLPFVASDVGSIRDLLPYGPSSVVPEGDIPALVAAIEKSLSDPAPRPLTPVVHDRLDGARHIITHLGFNG